LLHISFPVFLPDKAAEKNVTGGSCMSYEPVDIYKIIREDLEQMDGKLTPVKVNLLTRKTTHYASPRELHVNPDDEFSMPSVGPSESIISNYSSIARRNAVSHEKVYPEPIIVYKLKSDGYMMLNGHHRWAGALIAGVNKVHISIENPGPHYPGM
jgi:hypothetical protein